jgi:hypothetical protein
MNRLTGSIVLQNEDAWPLRVHGVILDHHGSVQSVDDIDDVYVVACEFLVAVKRYTHVAACHERAYFVQCLAQIPWSILSGVRPAVVPNEPLAAGDMIARDRRARRSVPGLALHLLIRLFQQTTICCDQVLAKALINSMTKTPPLHIRCTRPAAARFVK